MDYTTQLNDLVTAAQDCETALGIIIGVLFALVFIKAIEGVWR